MSAPALPHRDAHVLQMRKDAGFHVDGDEEECLCGRMKFAHGDPPLSYCGGFRPEPMAALERRRVADLNQLKAEIKDLRARIETLEQRSR